MIKIGDIAYDKEYKVFAWDSGFDQDKVVTDNGEQLISPSISKRLSDSAYSNRVSEHSKFDFDKMIIRYQQEEYRVGKIAINTVADGAVGDLEKDRFKKDEEIARLFALIANLNPKSENVYVDILMIGLPIATYQEYKKEIVEKYSGKTFTFEIPQGDGKYKKMTLHIRSCNVVPQGVGMYYDYSLDDNGTAKTDELVDRQYAVLDIGGKTTDSYISYGKNNIIPETVVPIDKGVTDSFKNVAKKIDNAPYTRVQQRYIAGKDTVFWNVEHKIKDLCESEFKLLAEDVYSAIHNAWVRYLPATEFILLGGGGGQVTHQHLSYLFDTNVILIDDPQMSNARGYLKLGMYIYNRKKS